MFEISKRAGLLSSGLWHFQQEAGLFQVTFFAERADRRTILWYFGLKTGLFELTEHSLATYNLSFLIINCQNKGSRIIL